MKTFTDGNRTVTVNDTERDILTMPPGTDRDMIETYLTELVSLPRDLRLASDHPATAKKEQDTIRAQTEYIRAVFVQHRRGVLLMSPVGFTTGSDERVSNRVAERILEETPLGRSMLRDLGAAGVYGFIDNLKTQTNRTNYRATLHRLMASLCMATHGADDLGSLPPEAFGAWLRFFRDDAGLRWRDDLWNSNCKVAYQCLRELTFAYARHTGHNGVTRLVQQKRSDSRAVGYWADIKNKPPKHIEPWRDGFHAWRTVERRFAKIHRQMFMHLVKWMDGNFPASAVADIAVFLSTRDRTPGFAAYLMDRRAWGNKTEAGSAVINHLYSAQRFSRFLAGELGLEQRGLGVWPLVTDAEIAAARNALAREGSADKPTAAKSRPLPQFLHHLAREILLEGERGWPGRCGVCRETVVRPDGTTEEVYCPVFPTLFLAVMELPLRVGQMKRLDSGEGDEERFDATTMSWGRNRGPNAGYWRDHAPETPDRGYAHRFDNAKPPFTGFRINTNKTGAPYVVPWENEALHRLLHDLRVWQETNNPIKGPITPMLYVDGIEDADEGKREDYPDIFPLFRLLADPRGGRQASPPNARRTDQFWYHLMAEVEERWNASNAPEDHIRIVKRNGQTGQPQSSQYNPHGLRVAGITQLLQQGVPIEVVSKLVAGHQSILMTLYYFKPDPAAVNAALRKAGEGRDAARAAAALGELKTCSIEAARRRAAYVRDDGLRAAAAMDAADKAQWIDVGIGFCPWGGNRCGDGGDIIRKDTRNGREHHVYGAVEGRPRNCVLCRHFVSGPAWLLPLTLFGTRLLRRKHRKEERVEDLTRELDDLHRRHQTTTEPDERKRLRREIGMRTTEQTALNGEIVTIAKGIWNTHQLVEACDRILSGADGDPGGGGGGVQDGGRALVARDGESLVRYLEASDFEQAALLTRASRIYPILHDAEAEAARDRFLDRILWDSYGTPLSFLGKDPARLRRSYDALADILMEELKREETAALTEGNLRLQDLGIGDRVIEVVSATLGEPILPRQMASAARLHRGGAVAAVRPGREAAGRAKAG